MAIILAINELELVVGYTIKLALIADYKLAINTFRENKRGERIVACYRFVVYCSMNSKMHMCITGRTRY